MYFYVIRSVAIIAPVAIAVYFGNLLCLSSSQAHINYYCREKYYRHLQNTCLESLKKYGNDPVLVFWKAFGVLMEGE